MARVYDIAIAALAIGVDKKWLDNLTAQHAIPGTGHFARGVPRRLSMRTLLTVAVVRDLSRGLGVPIARGVEVAVGIVADRAGDAVEVGERGFPERQAAGPSGVSAAADASPMVRQVGAAMTLSVDLARLEREIEARLVEAMETVVPRRRGRPPRKERRGTR